MLLKVSRIFKLRYLLKAEDVGIYRRVNRVLVRRRFCLWVIYLGEVGWVSLEK